MPKNDRVEGEISSELARNVNVTERHIYRTS